MVKNKVNWVFEAFARGCNSKYCLGKDVNIYKSESNKLNYCKKCNLVWERSHTGQILHHSNLPTYKLKRKMCNKCTKELKK